MEDFITSGMHWRVLNFFIFVAILFFFLKKPVVEFWKGRAHGIAFEMEEASRLRREAGQKVLDLEARVSHLDHEVRSLIQSLREEGDREKQKILEQTGGLLARMKVDARQMMTQEMQKTKELLKREMVAAAIEMTERVLKDQMRETDLEKLEQDFSRRLEERV